MMFDNIVVINSDISLGCSERLVSEKLCRDVDREARRHRFRGKDASEVMGSNSHGLPVVRSEPGCRSGSVEKEAYPILGDRPVDEPRWTLKEVRQRRAMHSFRLI